jgi:hypothetical protein
MNQPSQQLQALDSEDPKVPYDVRRHLHTIEERMRFVSDRASRIESKVNSSDRSAKALDYDLRERAALKWALGILKKMFGIESP